MISGTPANIAATYRAALDVSSADCSLSSSANNFAAFSAKGSAKLQADLLWPTSQPIAKISTATSNNKRAAALP
eukprot:CAMPEP_0177425060 /NCGR_PEP_ID=MMETSP0368-20130122/72789_1 /TAXON_ID=447022 ORGANISM="Scrippsiella hangoei-like, Strain SHHI-4" /NCGR_SAMPLE_ID=MMETSP0368 /ASSEMBLY_ACC=CAM_ASM_000363 /LENGTH=73 /DNA_ID=CAMNT_0018895297 /DNA_START=419 /DNA_END=637 /DNA_ORIENTATION=+